MHLWFFIISTIVGFLARLLNWGLYLILLSPLFLALLLFDVFLGYTIARISKPTRRLIRLTWAYSWAQLLMLLFQVESGITIQGTATFYGFLYRVHFIEYQPELLRQMNPVFNMIATLSLVAQGLIALWLLSWVPRKRGVKTGLERKTGVED